jgi:hypothetical protein
MHPTMRYHLALAHIGDLHHRARRHQREHRVPRWLTWSRSVLALHRRMADGRQHIRRNAAEFRSRWAEVADKGTT